MVLLESNDGSMEVLELFRDYVIIDITTVSVIKGARRVGKVIGIISITRRVLAMSWRGHFKNKRRYDTPGQTQWRSHRGPFPSSPNPKTKSSFDPTFPTLYFPHLDSSVKIIKSNSSSVKVKLSRVNREKKKEDTRVEKHEEKIHTMKIRLSLLRYWPPGLTPPPYAHRSPARADSWPTLVPGYA